MQARSAARSGWSEAAVLALARRGRRALPRARHRRVARGARPRRRSSRRCGQAGCPRSALVEAAHRVAASHAPTPAAGGDGSLAEVGLAAARRGAAGDRALSASGWAAARRRARGNHLGRGRAALARPRRDPPRARRRRRDGSHRPLGVPGAAAVRGTSRPPPGGRRRGTSTATPGSETPSRPSRPRDSRTVIVDVGYPSREPLPGCGVVTTFGAGRASLTAAAERLTQGSTALHRGLVDAVAAELVELGREQVARARRLARRRDGLAVDPHRRSPRSRSGVSGRLALAGASAASRRRAPRPRAAPPRAASRSSAIPGHSSASRRRHGSVREKAMSETATRSNSGASRAYAAGCRPPLGRVDDEPVGDAGDLRELVRTPRPARRASGRTRAGRRRAAAARSSRDGAPRCRAGGARSPRRAPRARAPAAGSPSAPTDASIFAAAAAAGDEEDRARRVALEQPGERRPRLRAPLRRAPDEVRHRARPQLGHRRRRPRAPRSWPSLRSISATTPTPPPNAGARSGRRGGSGRPPSSAPSVPLA